jgi:SET domain-containing protein
MSLSVPYVIRRSPIHGKGVFASRFITRGRKIGEYKGKILKKKQVIDSKRDCTYMMAIKRGQQYIDGSDLKKNPMGYINHPPEGRKANVRARELDGGRVFIYAVRDIKPGEELLFHYGFDPAVKACSLKACAK